MYLTAIIPVNLFMLALALVPASQCWRVVVVSRSGRTPAVAAELPEQDSRRPGGRRYVTPKTKDVFILCSPRVQRVNATALMLDG